MTKRQMRNVITSIQKSKDVIDKEKTKLRELADKLESYCGDIEFGSDRLKESIEEFENAIKFLDEGKIDVML